MKRSQTILLAGGATVAVVGAMLLLGNLSTLLSSASDRALLRPTDTKLTALGAEIYKNNCASCHGANLEGERNWQRPNSDFTMPAPPHDETGHTWHHDDETLFKLTKYGLAALINDKTYKSNMPAYENVLEDSEIIAVLSFIKSSWPKAVQQRHDELN